MEDKLVQPTNAQSPICVTESGMLMEDNLSQLSNAESPICVTESGMVMEDKLLQPANAKSPICVTESGIVKPKVPLSINAIRILLSLVYNACSSASKKGLLHSIL